MKAYLQKFNEQYKEKQSIDIELFNDEPLTMKYARYNQSGEVCYCMVGSNQANQKTKNGWEAIQCDTYNCEHRQKNEYGKSACNRVGWLKFIIPSVCKDRIFLMRITGQTSLNRLNEYFNLQKAQGHPIKGKYTIFLKQEEQTTSLGQTFNNYVLDILKKEDFISQNAIPETQQNSNQFSTNNNQNVNNKVVNNNTKTVTKTTEEIIDANNTTEQNTTENVSKEPTNKKTTTKETKSKSKKTTTQKSEQTKPTESKNKTTDEDDNSKNWYTLLSISNETIVDKEYLVGEFTDVQDKISKIAIRPEDAKELEKCNLGTVVKIDVSEIKGRKFAMKLEFIEKLLKKVAA